jgi:hypothetical protein
MSLFRDSNSHSCVISTRKDSLTLKYFALGDLPPWVPRGFFLSITIEGNATARNLPTSTAATNRETRMIIRILSGLAASVTYITPCAAHAIKNALQDVAIQRRVRFIACHYVPVYKIQTIGAHDLLKARGHTS